MDLDQELQIKKEELKTLRGNKAFKNLEVLLKQTKSLASQVDRMQLNGEDPEAEKKLWEILTMRVPKQEYLELRQQSYEQANKKLEHSMRAKKTAFLENKKLMLEWENKRKSVEADIEAKKKEEKLKNRFFRILSLEHKMNKESYREKLLKESLAERYQGKNKGY